MISAFLPHLGQPMQHSLTSKSCVHLQQSIAQAAAYTVTACLPLCKISPEIPRFVVCNALQHAFHCLKCTNVMQQKLQNDVVAAFARLPSQVQLSMTYTSPHVVLASARLSRKVPALVTHTHLLSGELANLSKSSSNLIRGCLILVLELHKTITAMASDVHLKQTASLSRFLL